MKYQVGDLVLIKEYAYKPRLHLYLHPRRASLLRLDLHLRLHSFPHLKNTYGIIIRTINHRDAWTGESTADDNIYFWYSQVNAKTYWFCEVELTQYEVVK